MVSAIRYPGRWRLAAILFTIFAVASAALADIKGTYKAKAEVRSESGVAKLDYTLKLDKEQRATLTIKRDGRPNWDRSYLTDYGDVLRHLEENSSVEFGGEWKKEDSQLEVRLDRLVSKSTEEVVTSRLRFEVAGNRLRIVEKDEALFGRRTEMDFDKFSRKANNDLLVAAAVIAGVAILANNTKEDSNRELVRRVDGRGWLSDGNIRTQPVDWVDLELLSNRFFRLRLDGGIELKGRWFASGDDYHLNIEELKKGRRWEDYQGSGLIRVRSRNRVRHVEFYAERARGSVVELDFDVD